MAKQELRDDHVHARREIRVADEFDDLVRTVAEHQVRGRHRRAFFPPAFCFR